MFLKVKAHDEVRLVKICSPESEEFSTNEIIQSVLQKVNIDWDCEITLRDRDGAQIFPEDFAEILLQYNCNCFFVELCVNESSAKKKLSSEVESIVNEKELKNYIKSGDFSGILNEYKTKSTLSDNSRRCLVRKTINFLRKHCGNHPKREEKIALAESTITLFPAFKVANSKFGGIDLFYNPESNSGYLAAKLKNINYKLTKLGDFGIKKRKLSSTGELENESSDEAEISKEDLDFFENCIVAEQLNLVKEKLQETLKARIKFIGTEPNVLEHFPIFLYDSTLIAFDFQLRYTETICNGLLQNWEKYENCIDEFSKDTSGESNLENFADWATDVLPYLKLLKLLPSSASGRQHKKVSFQQSANSFISFENVNTPIAEYEVGSSQPTIIAVGENKNTLRQYFITIDGKKINVPNSYKFSQVFDLYFKCFYLFNIQFDVILTNFLRFFAKFIYKIEDRNKASTRLLEVHSKFENKFKELTN